MYDQITYVTQATLKIPPVIVALAGLLLLSACAPTGAESWGQGGAASGSDAVAILGPSGPIGP